MIVKTNLLCCVRADIKLIQQCLKKIDLYVTQMYNVNVVIDNDKYRY